MKEVKSRDIGAVVYLLRLCAKLVSDKKSVFFNVLSALSQKTANWIDQRGNDGMDFCTD